MKKSLIKLIVIVFTLLLILQTTNFKPVHVYAKEDNNREVVVAIIDTGIDFNHDELNDLMWLNPAEIEGDKVDNDKNGYIDDTHGWNFYSNNNLIYNSNNTYDDHGTHCAGILAGLVSNVNVKIMSLKVLGGSNGTGDTQSLIKAIQYAEKMGADICNISLGTKYNDPALEKVIRKSEMLFVIAAGNGSNGNDNDINPIYPASYPLNNIISVANMGHDDELHVTSNYGQESIDLAAEGTKVYSTLTHKEYGYMSGTSMATIKVTGAVATVYSMYPNITLLQAKESVLNTVTPIPSLINKVATGGLLDYNKAISYYMPTSVNIIKNKTLRIGETYTLNPSFTPKYASTIYTYSSSNTKVVSVNKTTGKIKAKKKGTSVITIKTERGLIATCVVKVMK